MHPITRRLILVFLTTVFLGAWCFQALAQTPVHELECGKKKKIVWKIEGSPYIIMNAVGLPEHCTLEINKGVEVIFTGDSQMHVSGNLKVKGTKKEQVIFRYQGDPDFHPGNCMISINNTKAHIKGAVFRFAYVAICAGQSDLHVQDCLFTDNARGGIFLNESSAKILNSEFTRTDLGGVAPNGFCITTNNLSPTQIKTVEIIGNNFYGNVTAGQPDPYNEMDFDTIMIHGNYEYFIENNCIHEPDSQAALFIKGWQEADGTCLFPHGTIRNNEVRGRLGNGFCIFNEEGSDPFAFLNAVFNCPVLIENNVLLLEFDGILFPEDYWRGGFNALMVNNACANLINNRVEGWRINADEIGQGGVSIGGAGDFLVAKNCLKNNRQGLSFLNGPGTIHILKNEISGNYTGIAANKWNNVTIELNNIDNEGYNFCIPECELEYHVENNWWGTLDAAVIESKFCGPCSQGDALSSIHYIPFLTEPHPIDPNPCELFLGLCMKIW